MWRRRAAFSPPLPPAPTDSNNGKPPPGSSAIRRADAADMRRFPGKGGSPAATPPGRSPHFSPARARLPQEGSRTSPPPKGPSSPDDMPSGPFFAGPCPLSDKTAMNAPSGAFHRSAFRRGQPQRRATRPAYGSPGAERLPDAAGCSRAPVHIRRSVRPASCAGRSADALRRRFPPCPAVVPAYRHGSA